MKTIPLVILLLAALLGTTAHAGSPPPTPGRALPLKRVILYSNGVAYFERRGTVTDRAEIALPFKQSQVDDVLKSMVVLDLGRGRVGSVSYESSAPASARLSEIPFSIDAETGGLAAVLRQLQGARVAVASATASVSGAILNVETREVAAKPGEPPALSTRLVVASDSGEIASFDLESVRSVRLLDDDERRDVVAFAAATASARRRDVKTIVVTSDGSGAREMVVSYTVAAPIWKTSYRVVFDDSGQPFFQGWAIVDNTSDEDWSDVRLSLVSGAPVSFIQPLQQPLYRHRPVIAIPEDLALEPQVYEPGVTTGVPGGVPGGIPGGVPGGVAGGIPARPPSPDAVPPPPPMETSISDAIASETSGVVTAASGAEVGDLFEYRIDAPVTVPRNRSALIPILQARLEGERVSIYNEAARADRPYGGMRLKNTSSLTFEAGPVTVIDGDAYAGEALLARLKPGEERFVSFALDLATLVTTRSSSDREPVFLVRAIDGVFQAHFYETAEKRYTLTNQTDRPRVVYVEHPRRANWVIADAAQKPTEVTPSFYRFRVDLAPRATVTVAVPERRALMESYQISELSEQDLELFVSRRYVDESARAELDRIVELKRRVVDADVRIRAVEAERTEIAADQARLRENIKALGENAQARTLVARYVAKADEQETRLDELTQERKALEAERARLRADLATAIRALSLDQKRSHR